MKNREAVSLAALDVKLLGIKIDPLHLRGIYEPGDFLQRVPDQTMLGQIARVGTTLNTLNLSCTSALPRRPRSRSTLALGLPVPGLHASSISVDQELHGTFEGSPFLRESVKIDKGSWPKNNSLQSAASNAAGQHFVDDRLASPNQGMPCVWGWSIGDNVWIIFGS